MKPIAVYPLTGKMPLAAAHARAEALLRDEPDTLYEIVIRKAKSTRTIKQNSAIHLYCDLLADALNDAGFSVNDQVVLSLPVSFTGDNVKENIWKPVMTALYPDKTSTTQLEKMEVSEVYDNVNRAIAERTGVSVLFPSAEG